MSVEPNSHSGIWAYLSFRVVRWLWREGPELLSNSKVLIVALFTVLAAAAKSVFRWLRETDWELMVNRVFPRKKDRPK